MADEQEKAAAKPEKNDTDQVALELMKFITVTTGYGKATANAGFTGKAGASRTPEEQAESLLELFQRCRKAVKQPVE